MSLPPDCDCKWIVSPEGTQRVWCPACVLEALAGMFVSDEIPTRRDTPLAMTAVRPEDEEE